MPQVSTKHMLIQYFLKTLDQQAGQNAMNLVTETLMDFLAGAAGCTVFVLRAIVAVVLVDGLGVVTMCTRRIHGYPDTLLTLAHASNPSPCQ